MKKTSLVKTDLDQITYRLVGLAMDVHNEIGPGHREKAYHNALRTKIGQTDLEFLDEAHHAKPPPQTQRCSGHKKRQVSEQHIR